MSDIDTTRVDDEDDTTEIVRKTEITHAPDSSDAATESDDTDTDTDATDSSDDGDGDETATEVFVADPEPRRWRTVGLAVAAVVVLVVGAAAAVVGTRSGEALPGVVVDGQAVGGLTASELRERLLDTEATRQQAAVEVTANEVVRSYVPGEDGYRISVDDVVDAAMAYGRGSFWGSLGDHLGATFGSTHRVDLAVVVDDAPAVAFVTDLAAAADEPPFDGAVAADPTTLAVTIEAPRPGLAVDREALVTALVDRTGRAEATTLDAELVASPSPVTEADLDAAAAQARRLLEGTVDLTANGATLTLAPADLARLVTSEVNEFGQFVLAVDTPVLRALVDPVREQFEIAPEAATYEIVSGLVTFDDQGDTSWTPTPAELAVVAGVDGQTIDVDVLAAQLGRAFNTSTRSVTMELVATPPDKNADVLADAGVDHLLGTFTTYHACCASRVTNIQRLADLVRGQVLLPGETFSVNDFVGPRTAAKGFVQAGAIVNGQIKPEFGGGISQFATTMYNAAFFAGIPILDSRAHSLYISRYPRGREATLNYDSIDLEIENDTGAPIYLHTSYTPESITVSIFGADHGRTTSAIMGEPYNFRGIPTRRIPNPALPAGTERRIQSGHGGYDVNVIRVIEGADGTRREETIVTNYSAKPTIIEVGSGAAPAPAPPPPDDGQPAPEPDPEPAPEPEPEPAPEPEPEPEPAPDPSDT